MIEGKLLKYEPFVDSRGESGLSGQLYLTEWNGKKYLVKSGKVDALTEFVAHRLATIIGVPSSDAILIKRGNNSKNGKNVQVGIEFFEDFTRISMDAFLGGVGYDGEKNSVEIKYPDDSPLLSDLMKYLAFRQMTIMEDNPQLAISNGRLVSFDYAESFYLSGISVDRMIYTDDTSHPLQLFRSHLALAGSLQSNLKVIHRAESEFLREAYLAPLYEFLDADLQPIFNELAEVYPSVIARFFSEAFEIVKKELLG